MPPSLLDPQNLVFLAPFAAGLLLALLSLAGGSHGSHGHAAHGHGGHSGGGHSGGAQAAHAHAAPAHAGAHPAQAGSSQSAQRGPVRAPIRDATSSSGSRGSLFLTVTGLDQAPLPLLLWTFLIGWGFAGFWVRYLLHATVDAALPVAGIGGLLIARAAAALASRLIPPDTTSAMSREQLLGSTGHVVYPVSNAAGRVHVYDQFGTLHEETCRLETGETPIEKGCEVLLIDYDDRRRLFLVARVGALPATAAERPRSTS